MTFFEKPLTFANRDLLFLKPHIIMFDIVYHPGRLVTLVELRELSRGGDTDALFHRDRGSRFLVAFHTSGAEGAREGVVTWTRRVEIEGERFEEGSLGGIFIERGTSTRGLSRVERPWTSRREVGVEVLPQRRRVDSMIFLIDLIIKA